MIKRALTLPWLILLLAALLLSACGGELSGEPEIEREIEIVPRPTAVPTSTPLPTPTADPAAAADSDTSNTDPAAEVTPLPVDDFDLPPGVTWDDVYAVAAQMTCDVCEDIPLDQCGSIMCSAWREEIARLLGEGYTDDEIIDYFAERYGSDVVLVPLPADETPGTAAADEAPTPTDVPADEVVDTGGGDYDLGFSLFVEMCAQCHGAGDSVGPGLATMRDVAATRVEELTPVEYVRQSILDPGAFVVSGYTNVMPQDYATQLTDDELAALVTFILEFDPSRMGMTNDSSSSTVDTPDLDNPEETFDVQGRLVAGTAGGEDIPAGLPLELFIFDPNQGVELKLFKAESGEGGTFDFTGIPYVPDVAYVIETDYQGMTQGLRIDVPEPPIDAPVTPEVRLYEHTTDPAGVMVTWAVMLVDYTPIDEFGIEVWLSAELANTGDRMVTTDHMLEDGTLASVAMELPVGAFGIQIIPSSDQPRYEIDVVDNVPTVYDRSPLRPGQVHTISMVYYLPYDSSATLVTAMGYPVIDAAVLLPNDTVDFDSEQFDTAGQWEGRIINDDIHGMRIVAIQDGESVDPERDFTLIKTHDLQQALPADVPLEFSLEGRPTRTLAIINQPMGGGGSGTEEDDNWLPLVLGGTGLGVILVAAGLWWRQRQTDMGDAPESGTRRAEPAPRAAMARFVPRSGAGKEVLLAALADLDDAFKGGEIDEEHYHAQRATITERLLPLLDENED